MTIATALPRHRKTAMHTGNTALRCFLFLFASLMSGELMASQSREATSIPWPQHDDDHRHWQLHWQLEPATGLGQAQIILHAHDGRWYRHHQPIAISPRQRAGSIQLQLEPGHWTGSHGPLDRLARRSLSHLEVQAEETAIVKLELLRSPLPATAAEEFLLRLSNDSLLIGEHFIELRFGLDGVRDDQRVELVLEPDRHIPAWFARAERGPARFHARLPPDFLASLQAGKAMVQVLQATDQQVIWRCPWPQMPGQKQESKHHYAARPPWPWLENASSQTWSLLNQRQGQRLEIAPAFPLWAPILRWRKDWTGFAGFQTSSHAMATALDARLSAGDWRGAIELLPAAWGKEQGLFHFGTHPLHQLHGGRWQQPQDLLLDQAGQELLIDHAHEVLARSHWSPQIVEWQMGWRVADDGSAAQRASLETLHDQLKDLVKRYDHRPLRVYHPALLPFTQQDHNRHWSESGNIYRLELDHQGLANLALSPDRSFWEIDQQHIFVRFHGSGGCSVHAWMIDDEHRYYRQELGHLQGNGRRQRMVIDWMEGAAWQPEGHQTPWQLGRKRRVRQFGILASADEIEISPTNRVLEVDPGFNWSQPLRQWPEVEWHWLHAPETAIAAWQPYEARFALSREVDNPYDPQQAEVSAELNGPQGQRFRFPAFWIIPQQLTLDGNRELARPKGEGHWAWRFSFPEAGQWRLRFQALLHPHSDAEPVSAESAWFTVEVAPAEPTAQLPVERSADPRYFQTIDGSWFYPMGLTIRSPGDERQNILTRGYEGFPGSRHFEGLGTQAYEHWFTQLANAGGNFVRIWMSPWWGALEWNRDWDGYGGLGRYNQGNAARMDRLLELARKHGIYMQWELLNHGMTSETVDQQWHPDPQRGELGSPFNQLNGGPIRHAHEFYSDETAWRYHQMRLRYIIARWGHAPQVMAWVLSSEMEFTGAFWNEAYNRRSGSDHSPTLNAWIERNLDWFSEYDPIQRPVTVHFSHPWRAAQLWRSLSRLGFNYSNAYTGYQRAQGQLGHPRSGLGGALLTYLRTHFPSWQLGRPTLLGEWGGHWQEQNSAVLEAEWHSGLWMQAVLPFAGNTGFWWWLWVDASSNWQRLQPVRQFLSDDDPRGSEMLPIIPRIRPGEVRAHIIGSQGNGRIRAYAYLRGLDTNDLSDSLRTRAKDEHAGSAIFQVNAGERWRLRRYNTSNGKVVDDRLLAADEEGRLEVHLGHLTFDAGFKLDRQDPSSDAGNAKQQ
ncbi:MAG: DUF5060 domain-containing protein [Planctomycetota bacterium]|nr:MAG: DUF5060 domain-containing protein [Planctomycetota bacterium]